jgi:hypothetical protein
LSFRLSLCLPDPEKKDEEKARVEKDEGPPQTAAEEPDRQTIPDLLTWTS